MAMLALTLPAPPIAPDKRPSEDEEAWVEFAGHISSYLSQLQQAVEENAEAYLSSTASLATGIIVADHIQAGTITATHLITTEAIITTAAQIQDALITSAKIISLESQKIYVTGNTAQTLTTAGSTMILPGLIQISGGSDSVVAMKAKGTASGTLDGGARSLLINGVEQITGNNSTAGGATTTTRGLCISVINTAGALVAGTAGLYAYDTYGSTAANDSLSTHIEGVSAVNLIVLTSYDALGTALVSGNLGSSLLSLGIDRTALEGMFTTGGNGLQPTRIPFVGLGHRGSGPGSGVTVMTNGSTAAGPAIYEDFLIGSSPAAGSSPQFSNVTIIEGGQIRTDSITATQIAAGAITASELAAGSVIAGKIAAGVITAVEIAADTITGAQIAAGAIAADEIAAGAVTAAKIAADTITAAQIAAGAITTDELAAGAVTAAKIAADTITANEIAASAITTTELAASAVTATKIAADTITAAQIAAGAITTDELAAGAVTAAKIAAGTITATEIAADTITGAQIAAGAIAAGELAAGAVTAGKIAADAVTATEIAAGAVTVSELANGAVTTVKVAAGAITVTEIADNAVTTTKIAAGSITTPKLTTTSAIIQTAHIEDLSVTRVKIGDNAVTSHAVDTAVNVTALTSVYADILSLSITVQSVNDLLVVDAQAKVAVTGSEANDTTDWRVIWDGVTVTQEWAGLGNATAATNVTAAGTLFSVRQTGLSAAAHTVALQGKMTDADAGGELKVNIESGYLLAIDYQK